MSTARRNGWLHPIFVDLSEQPVVAPLVHIAERATEAAMQPPALVVVGNVVGLRSTLGWCKPVSHAGAAGEEAFSCKCAR